MKIIATYDIKGKNGTKVLKTFRKYLTWIQLSVFEGEITETNLKKLKLELKKIIDPKIDSILFFELHYPTNCQKVFLGREFDHFDNFI